MANDLHAETVIDAAPERVWAVVSDLKRMSEWSPQTRKMIIRGGPIREGSTTININQAGWRVWPTTAKVTTFEPGRKLAWKVRENHTVWSYELQPLDDGSRTRVIERREAPGGTTQLSQNLIDRFFGGEQKFETQLVSDMNDTLAKIKRTVERG